MCVCENIWEEFTANVANKKEKSKKNNALDREWKINDEEKFAVKKLQTKRIDETMKVQRKREATSYSSIVSAQKNGTSLIFFFLVLIIRGG